MLYTAFGLSLAANRPIAGLTAQTIPAPPDILVHFDDPSTFAGVSDGVEEPYYVGELDAGIPALEVWTAPDGRYFRLRYADDTQFLVDKAGRHVRATAPPASTLEDIATYLLGPVLGFVMRLRGVTCLHASVVSVGDHAIAIAGPPGAGKSTAAAGFAAMGHAVLADDVAALVECDGRLHVQAAYPQLRLWPDSVAMLYGTPDALPRLTPTWDKRARPLSEPGEFQPQPLPLRAVYVLGEYGDRSGTIEDVTGVQRVLLLLANTYVGYLLDPPMRRQELDRLVQVAATVPIRRVSRASQSTNVSAICAQMLADCEGMHV